MLAPVSVRQVTEACSLTCHRDEDYSKWMKFQFRVNYPFKEDMIWRYMLAGVCEFIDSCGWFLLRAQKEIVFGEK